MKNIKRMAYSLFACLFVLSSCVSNPKAGSYDYDQRIFSDLSSVSSEKSEIDDLNFTSTQTWLPNYLGLCDNKAIKSYIPIFTKFISMEPPPQNNSPRTKAELQYLIRLQKKLTPSLKNRIVTEKANANLQIGRQTLNELIMDDQVRMEFPFVFSSYETLLGIIMYYKKKFNRVRPSYLDKSITPFLSVPLHPAYPSGHSAEAYYWAAFFSEVDPNSSSEFLASAFEIAKNREYAGLHYPSDSQAGKSLGGQVFSFFMKDSRFREDMQRFKEYYQRRKLSRTK